MSHDPEVHTLDPADAHPLYLRWMNWLNDGLRIAVALARSGEIERARRLEAAVDAAIVAVGDSIPRTREP